jgi:hypothetical protein
VKESERRNPMVHTISLIVVLFLADFAHATGYADGCGRRLIAVDKERVRELRDQGIKNIGWIAGNAAGNPIWPEIEQYVGKRGVYYEFFVRLRTPGGPSDDVQAYSNVSLYNDWVKIGERVPYNEEECTARTQRTLQIIGELTKMLKSETKD